jgi:hypothetical protein
MNQKDHLIGNVIDIVYVVLSDNLPPILDEAVQLFQRLLDGVIDFQVWFSFCDGDMDRFDHETLLISHWNANTPISGRILSWCDPGGTRTYNQLIKSFLVDLNPQSGHFSSFPKVA